MTEKQRQYIEFIEEMTGVQYHQGESISDYINANKDEARRNWELECYARGADLEDAGDRD
jgi:hypothetical protein